MKHTISIPSEFNDITLENHLSGVVQFYHNERMPNGDFPTMDVHFETESILLNEFTITYVAFDEEGKHLIDVSHIELLREPIMKVMEKNKVIICDELHTEWQQSDEYQSLPTEEEMVGKPKTL